MMMMWVRRASRVLARRSGLARRENEDQRHVSSSMIYIIHHKYIHILHKLIYVKYVQECKKIMKCMTTSFQCDCLLIKQQNLYTGGTLM